MKSQLKIISLLAGASLFVLACDPEEVITPEISVDPTSLIFTDASPTAQTIEVTSTAAWEATTEADWLSIDPTSGDGDSFVTVAAEANEADAGSAAAERSAVITFTIEGQSVTVEVTQSGETVVFAATGETTSVSAAGATVAVKVETNQSYTYSSSADWCTYLETKATKTEYVYFTVAANSSLSARTADITLTPTSGSAVTVTISQEGVTPTASSTVTISSLEDLAAILANADYLAMTDVTWQLATDLDLQGASIAGTDATFKGIFDGADYSIKNATFTKPILAQNDGTIKNLVIDATCSATATTGNFGILVGSNYGTISSCVNNAAITLGDYDALTYLGAIAGYSEGLVENCTNNGAITITASTTTSNSIFGGVVGCFKGTDGTASVSGCTNTGTITYSVTGTPKNPVVGGVVGGTTPTKAGNGDAASRAAAAPNVGLVKGCTNGGDVLVSWTTSASGSYTNIGGVAGYLEADIEDCSNGGKVSLETPADPSAASTRPTIGGVAGYVMYSAKDCVNTGHVVAVGIYAAGTNGNASAGAMHQPNFGGVIGGIGYGYLEVASGEVMEGCKNYGQVDFTVAQKTAGGTKSNTGGVAGYCSTEIVSDCHNYGVLNCAIGHNVDYVGGVIGLGYNTSITNCSNEAALAYTGMATALDANTTNKFSYQIYVGGIVGYVFKGATLSSCQNTAAVTFSDVVTTAAYSYLGGINGSYSGSITMTGCSNSGSVTSDATAVICTGGLSGGFNGTMSDCTNTGAVSAANSGNASGKESEVGGIVGYANASFSGCSNTGAITTGPAGTYCGGLIGGFGAANLLVYNGSVDCAITGEATTGSILGRYRTTTDVYYIYYTTTIGSGLSSLSINGAENCGGAVNTEQPAETA